MSLTIAEQQDVAKSILSFLRILDPNAVLAGGAPSDWDRGIPARDLDFYLSAPYYAVNELSTLHDILRKTLMQNNIHFLWDFTYEGQGDHLFAAFEVVGLDKGIPVQVMIVKDPRVATHSFSYNYSRVSWDGWRYHRDTEYHLYKEWGICYEMRKGISSAYKVKIKDKMQRLGATYAKDSAEALDLIGKMIDG